MPSLPKQILIFSTGLLLTFEIVLRVTGWQAEFAESNMQANLIRIAKYEFHPVPKNLILGSSLSGRLLPEYFSPTNQPLGNMALDGAGVPMGLELVVARREKPERIFLEANTIMFRSLVNEETLREALDNPVFELGRYFFSIRPGSRPSALLYSWLKRIREKKGVGATGQLPSCGPGPSAHGFSKEWDLLRQMQKNGVQIFLVLVPSGTGELDPVDGWQTMATELGAKWIRPRNHLPAKGQDLRYTDGLHLDRVSAQKVCWAIEKELSLESAAH